MSSRSRSCGAEGPLPNHLDTEPGRAPAPRVLPQLELMDCIACHNRITHLILPPEDTVDELLARKVISSTIPEIRLKAVEGFREDYPSLEVARSGIAGLE